MQPYDVFGKVPETSIGSCAGRYHLLWRDGFPKHKDHYIQRRL